MPETMSIERRKILHVLGAEVVLTEAYEGMDGAVKKLKPEVERTLAYYITGCHAGCLFKRRISKVDGIVEMSKLIEDEEDKVKGILEILIPAFYNSNSIIMLHCITGLQAVITLKNYFEDYIVALDIFTTTALTHLLTQIDLDIRNQNTKIEAKFD